MRALLMVLSGVTLIPWYFAMFGGELWAFYVTTVLAAVLIPLWIRFERRHSVPRKQS